jgi:hypothetical protein
MEYPYWEHSLSWRHRHLADRHTHLLQDCITAQFERLVTLQTARPSLVPPAETMLGTACLLHIAADLQWARQGYPSGQYIADHQPMHHCIQV